MIKRIGLFLLLASCVFGLQTAGAYTLPENVIAVKILSLNREHNFLVIDAGTQGGIAEGMSLNLLKDGKNIAMVQVMRSKERVSACDIKHVEPNVTLKEGDIYSITIAARADKYRARILREPIEEAPAKDPLIKRIFSRDKDRQKKKISQPHIGVLPAMVRIEARREIVNYYLNEALRDMNFIVTSSNVKEGIFTAHKFLPIPLWDQLWADFKGTTDHRAIYDINTIDDESGTTLKLNIRTSYTDRKGRARERNVGRNSSIIADALKLIERVKNNSEILTKER